MKKLRLAITALILCALCLSACGEKGNEYVKAVEKDPSPENVCNLVLSSAEKFKISGGYEFDVSRANLTIIIDSEGTIVSEKYNFGARFHIGSDTVDASIVITEEIDKSDPEITLPSDESEYKYVDSNG